MLSGG